MSPSSRGCRTKDDDDASQHRAWRDTADYGTHRPSTSSNRPSNASSSSRKSSSIECRCRPNRASLGGGQDWMGDEYEYFDDMVCGVRTQEGMVGGEARTDDFMPSIPSLRHSSASHTPSNLIHKPTLCRPSRPHIDLTSLSTSAINTNNLPTRRRRPTRRCRTAIAATLAVGLGLIPGTLTPMASASPVTGGVAGQSPSFFESRQLPSETVGRTSAGRGDGLGADMASTLGQTKSKGKRRALPEGDDSDPLALARAILSGSPSVDSETSVEALHVPQRRSDGGLPRHIPTYYEYVDGEGWIESLGWSLNGRAASDYVQISDGSLVAADDTPEPPPSVTSLNTNPTPTSAVPSSTPTPSASSPSPSAAVQSLEIPRGWSKPSERTKFHIVVPYIAVCSGILAIVIISVIFCTATSRRKKRRRRKGDGEGEQGLLERQRTEDGEGGDAVNEKGEIKGRGKKVRNGIKKVGRKSANAAGNLVGRRRTKAAKGGVVVRTGVSDGLRDSTNIVRRRRASTINADRDDDDARSRTRSSIDSERTVPSVQVSFDRDRPSSPSSHAPASRAQSLYQSGRLSSHRRDSSHSLHTLSDTASMHRPHSPLPRPSTPGADTGLIPSAALASAAIPSSPDMRSTPRSSALFAGVLDQHLALPQASPPAYRPSSLSLSTTRRLGDSAADSHAASGSASLALARARSPLPLDPEKRAQAERMSEALSPTLRAGMDQDSLALVNSTLPASMGNRASSSSATEGEDRRLMIGHVATDDKAVLGRMRQMASRPGDESADSNDEQHGAGAPAFEDSVDEDGFERLDEHDERQRVAEGAGRRISHAEGKKPAMSAASPRRGADFGNDSPDLPSLSPFPAPPSAFVSTSDLFTPSGAPSAPSTPSDAKRSEAAFESAVLASRPELPTPAYSPRDVPSVPSIADVDSEDGAGTHTPRRASQPSEVDAEMADHPVLPSTPTPARGRTAPSWLPVYEPSSPLSPMNEASAPGEDMVGYGEGLQGREEEVAQSGRSSAKGGRKREEHGIV